MSNKIVVNIDKDLKEIMPGFLKNRNQDLADLVGHINNNDLKNIEVIGHKLAGNAGGYGLQNLGDIGSALEEAAQKHDVESIKKLIAKYNDFINRLEINYV